MTSPDRELDAETTARTLGLPVALVIQRMDDGRLQFRQEGDRRLETLEDVTKLKAALQEQEKVLRRTPDWGCILSRYGLCLFLTKEGPHAERSQSTTL